MIHMIWNRIVSLAVVALMALAFVGCGARSHPFDPAPATAAVRALLATQQAAWNRGDLVGFMEGYWKSDSLTFYSGGDVNQGWQATFDRYVRRYRSEGREMGTLDFDLQEVTASDPDHALVYGAWRLKRSADAPHGLFTLVLRRIPGAGWRIVHDHTSVAE
jgi:ketosteroid isomerase-like protein